MMLFAGLGNPGPKHAGQRHNIGFMVADAIVERYGFSPYRSRFQSLASEGTIAGEKILVMKPQTYMNRSGQAVGEAMRYFKMAPADVVVFYDEIDLTAGKIKVKTGGGAAGHNGIRSIASHIGPDFRRVRLGIGHPGDKEKVHGHVLGDFAKADREWLATLIEAVAAEAHRLVERDDERFMTDIALRLQAGRG